MNLTSVDLRNSRNLEVESYVLLGKNFRASSQGDGISGNHERTVLRRWGEESG